MDMNSKSFQPMCYIHLENLTTSATSLGGFKPISFDKTRVLLIEIFKYINS